MNDKPNDERNDDLEDELRDANVPADDAEDESASSLWQLLNEEGSIVTPGAPSAASLPEEPAPVSPDPAEAASKLQSNPWELEAEWRAPEGEAVDSSAAASHLRQILDAPEEVDESFEYRAGPLGAVGDDFDSAIQAYIRNVDTGIKCRKHANRDSVAQCPECQAYYCQECMTIRRGRMLCRDCAETVFLATEEEILSAQEQGVDEPGSEVALDSPPEFQVHAEWMGLEGAPASPAKVLAALLIDFLAVRGLLFVALLVFNALGMLKPEAFTSFFDPEVSIPMSKRVIDTFLLMKPLVPWLPIFIATDFLYYFLSLSFTNRTLGMSWLSCRIVTQWGEFVPFGTVVLRTIVFMVLFELPAVLLSLVMPHFRGPHDIVSGTLVINYAGVKRVDAYETVQIKI
jgi:uncharacterized RDD family membrane protein YckC